MATSIITPNMNLIVPIVGQEPSPTYAQDINNSLTIVDSHSHALGSGVQITPAAMNINASLSMGENDLINIAALTLIAQSGSQANQSLYVSGVDLYYADGNGNAIQITTGGAVNATSSGISSGSASASFSGGVLIVDQASNTPGNIQAGSILIGNNVASSKFVTLSAPNSLASNYQLFLPTIPAQTNVVSLDSSGNLGSITYDQVGEGMTATGANAIAASRTRAYGGSTEGIGGVPIGFNSGNYSTNSPGLTNVTNMSVTITTSGRPVWVGLIADSNGGANNSYFQSQNGYSIFCFLRNGAAFRVSQFGNDRGAPFAVFPPSSASMIDFVGAGTYTYTFAVAVLNADLIVVDYCDLVAYEL